jgi:hypothetical protein
VELLELGVFGGENLKWSCFIGYGAAWSSSKHVLNLKLHILWDDVIHFPAKVRYRVKYVL